jgi:hypothetical protein
MPVKLSGVWASVSSNTSCKLRSKSVSRLSGEGFSVKLGGVERFSSRTIELVDR